MVIVGKIILIIYSTNSYLFFSFQNNARNNEAEAILFDIDFMVFIYYQLENWTNVFCQCLYQFSRLKKILIKM